ncbi:MAG TPA: GNAT family N-acetyltransferase [Ktedonobacteraceae bacterium]
MQQNQRLNQFVQEIEHGLYGRTYTWEGKPERVLDLGEVVVHAQPNFALVLCLCFTSPQINQRLDHIIYQIEKHFVQRQLWVIGPHTQPADLEARLTARGFTRKSELKGLVLEDLSLWSANNPEVVVEPLSWENADAYAAMCSPDNNTARGAEQLLYAYRYLQSSPKEIHIFIARLEGRPAGYALLRLEPNGTANLCDAFTLPEARGRGVYLSLVAHRLAEACKHGSTLAVTRANTRTSAPILMKRGFTPICSFFVFNNQK